MAARAILLLALLHLTLLGAAAAGLAAADAFDAATIAIAGGALGAAFAVSAAAVLALAIGAGRVAAAARRVADGDLSRRTEGASALGELASAFDEMAAILEARVAATSQEQSRLEAVLNSSIDAVLAIDVDGRVAFVNTAAEALFQRAEDELVGQPFGYALPDEQLLEAMRASREEGEQRVTLTERPNHQFLQVVTTPIEGGGEWAALAVFHDVSDTKRTEQMRRDFIGNVSHELRTPLASIKALIETLEGGALDDPQAARDFLARGSREVDRLVELVEELLELSRLESGEVPMAREPVDLGGVAGRAVERLRPQARIGGVELAAELPDGLPAVLGDADRLERAAMSLLHNALKFTPEGGSVRVRTEGRDGSVALQVIDTGAGIAPEDIGRVFERFYKADRARRGGGTGLGLAIAKHTIEAHGGQITVESEEGRGSTFTITMPAADSAAP